MARTCASYTDALEQRDKAGIPRAGGLCPALKLTIAIGLGLTYIFNANFFIATLLFDTGPAQSATLSISIDGG